MVLSFLKRISWLIVLNAFWRSVNIIPVNRTSLSMNSVQSHLHVPTHASVYLGMLLSHVQNFILWVNHMPTLQQVRSVILLQIIHLQLHVKYLEVNKSVWVTHKSTWAQQIWNKRSSHQRCSLKQGVLKIFAYFTVKH